MTTLPLPSIYLGKCLSHPRLLIKPRLARWVAALGLCWSVACPAATLTVTSANDSGAGTLRQAILSAVAGDTINFAANVSTINLTSGELLIGKNLTISGPGPGLLTVQRSSANYFRVFDVTSSGVTATVSGLGIANGNAWNANGGGIYNAGSLTVTNCAISGNTCNDFGCGIYNSGLMTVTNCAITGNTETEGGGGGIENAGRMTIVTSTISDNASTGGGGIYNLGTGTLTVHGSVISGNSANYAGGGGIGGGILNYNGIVTLTNSTISGNSANPYSPTSGQDTSGGGIYTSGGAMTITNCTITANSSTGYFSGSFGGGIYNNTGTSSVLTVRNCVIAKNTTPGAGPDVSGTLTSQGCNLIGNSAGATITPAQSSDQLGTAGSPIDPLLGPLQNNGGLTFTCALLSGSLAIDAGDDSVLSAPLSFTTDQRGTGFPRKVGAHVDIGASEFGAGVVAPVVATLPATGITFSGATLSGRVTAGNNSTSVSFDYGASVSYGTNVAAAPSPVTGNMATAVSFALTGLPPNTTYHYRVNGTSSVANASGKDLTFTTLDQPPSAVGDTVAALPSAKVTIDVLANDSGAGGAVLSVYSFTQPGAAVGTVARLGTKLVFTPSATFPGGYFTYIAADAFGGRSPATAVTLNPGTCLCASFLNAASDQGGKTLQVTASAPFTVTGKPTWLSFNPILPGDTQVTFVFSPNPSLSSRTATITVGGNPVTVIQSGVVAAPVLTVPSNIPNAAISASYDLAIPTQNGPVTYTASGLPPGLTLSNITGHVTGMPTVANTYHVSVSAKNAKGSTAAPILFDITVLPFPALLVGGWTATMDRNATVNLGMGGLLSFTVTANGPVTGTLKSGTASYPFTGRLNTAPNPANPTPLNARLTVAIPHTSLVIVVDMNSPSAGHITGTVSLGATTANLSGAQQVWSLAGHPAATDYSGNFTTALQPTSTDASIPQGDGFLTFSVSTTGVVSWSGQLADGSVLATGSSALWPGGEVPLYASLYTGKGSLLGALVITAATRVLTGNMSWSKNAQPATVRAYGAGFGVLNPASLALLGGGYTPPAIGLAVLTNVIPPTGSAQITFVDGGIGNVGMAASLTQTLTISSANVATLPSIFGGNVANIKITSINAAHGTFVGSLTLKDTNPFDSNLPQVARTVSFNGVFLQGGNNLGTGYFLLPAITGPPANVTTSPETSGQVLITPQ